MVPQLCRYVVSVETIRKIMTAQKIPVMPMGKICRSAIGTSTWLRMASRWRSLPLMLTAIGDVSSGEMMPLGCSCRYCVISGV